MAQTSLAYKLTWIRARGGHLVIVTVSHKSVKIQMWKFIAKQDMFWIVQVCRL